MNFLFDQALLVGFHIIFKLSLAVLIGLVDKPYLFTELGKELFHAWFLLRREHSFLRLALVALPLESVVFYQRKEWVAFWQLVYFVILDEIVNCLHVVWVLVFLGLIMGLFVHCSC